MALDSEEAAYVAEAERGSKRAFEGATQLSPNDPRWHLILAKTEQAVPRVTFHDELRSSLVLHQLVMYIPESLLERGGARLPSVALLYRWANVFHPVTTLSFASRGGKKVKNYRGYFLEVIGTE